MTIDPPAPDADPADVAEQHLAATPTDDQEDAVDELPLEADEADVAEQRMPASGWNDDLDGDPDEDIDRS
ncbi:MAG: hypothetical protein JWQ15_1080 [Marmoricola sp.]|jgi:hypothetical protein|nr:hypothetical protein [Marmoricola sp.]